MGIIDFVKGGIRELAVARPDEAKGLVVYKHPDKTIPKKAQVTVEADEVALFFRDGKLVGQLASGRHSLETDNIPFLDQIVDWGTGGNVWIAEVYFVTTREVPGLKFGGKVGKLRDPQSGLPVEVMVNGTFSIRVIDPPKLVIGLVGLQKSNNEEFLAWFKEQVLKTIRDDVAELCVKKKWPLLDVTSGAYTEELCAEVEGGLRPHVEPYGIEVARIGNFNLAMKDEDEKRLNKLYENAAYMNMAGGVQGFQQVAAASAMMNAGEALKQGGGGGNLANNPLLAGAGLGVGLAMAGQFQQAMQPGTQTPAGTQAMPPGIPGATPSGASSMTCSKCQKQVAPGKFCAECGSPLAAATPKFCSGCGQSLPPSGRFCPGCGQAAAG
ncbi:MAG: SPFH domain-containing protein [Deltaproteobacteria bacterium]|nr:SPFH domain-containing protein [Deltaproteobacteria bacterium]